jgi:hypothetical protein
MAKTINVISCVGQSNPHHRSRRDMSRVYMDDSTPFMGFRKAGTCYTLRSHKSSPPLDPYNASNQSVLLSQNTKEKMHTLSDTPEYRYRITPNLGRSSSVHAVLPPVLPTVLLGWKRFRVHHGATLAGSSSQFCSRVVECYQRLLDQITILKAEPGLQYPEDSGRLPRRLLRRWSSDLDFLSWLWSW